MKKQLLFYTCLLLALYSCQQEQVVPKEEVQLRKLSIEERELINASNSFAMELSQQLMQERQRNIFFSPYYIHMGLAMATNGAEKNTLTQMQKTQHHDVLERLEVNKLYNSLDPLLHSIDEHVRFVSAHSLWYREDIDVLPLFSDMLMAYYNAGVEPLDFSDRKASLQISKWIEDHTSGKVDALLPTLIPYESLYMFSATHLKGQWTYPFAKDNTAPGTFYLEDEKEVTVPMMFTDQATYRYYQDEHKTLIDIPYGNRQYSMTILMPQAGDSISGQLAGLNIKSLEQDLAQADTLDYNLYLPKFSISSQTDLKKPLFALGIRDAFTARADFSGMMNDPLAPGIKIADMVHQAGIEVNESGTQSAIPKVAAANIQSTTPVVRINRPFMFFIREHHTGVILYAGVVQNPVEVEE